MRKMKSGFGRRAKADREQKLKKTKTKETSEHAPVKQLPSYDVREINIADILVPEGRRALNPEKLKELKESVSLLGLQTPITVRPVKIWGKDKYDLVIGLHRLEVTKQQGKTTIPCFILEGDERAARMWEISENLDRADLTPLEHDNQVAEWVRLIEADGQNVHQVGQSRPKGGISAAARKLPIKGKTHGGKRRAVERAVKVASISPEAQEAAKKAGLDTIRSKLLKIADEKTPAAQLAKVRELAKTTKKATPKKPLSAADEKALEQLIEAWNKADELKRGFIKASPNVRDRFIAKIRQGRLSNKTQKRWGK
jgi:ParB/RepB/Spo0J family partition protein